MYLFANHVLNKILIFFCGILTVIGCSRSFKAPERLPQPSDSLYTARAALKIYANSLEGRAGTMTITVNWSSGTI